MDQFWQSKSIWRTKNPGGGGTARKIAEMVGKNKRLTARHLQDLTYVPKSVVHRVMAEDLKLKKLCARRVAHLLGHEEKQQRIDKARDLWVTGDESWFILHQMESKQQNMVLRFLGSPSGQGNEWQIIWHHDNTFSHCSFCKRIFGRPKCHCFSTSNLFTRLGSS